MKHIAVFFVRLYQKCISPLKPPCCRFTPTCSAYAIDAFQKRGFFVGLLLSLWRILRCNPFAKAGYDPVPEKGFKSVPIRSREKSNSEKEGVTPTSANQKPNEVTKT